MEIADKVAVVTGAGSGIGRASACALAAAGAHVVVADIDPRGGEETVALIEQQGGAAKFVESDVSTPSGVRELFDTVDHLHGGMDILHNNAAIVSGGKDTWPDSSLERIAQVINTNCTSMLMASRRAIDSMRPRGGGVVVSTGSAIALGPFPFEPIYGASKAGIAFFTQSVASMVESHNIRFTGVIIGAIIDTPIWGKFADGDTPPDWARHLLAQQRVDPSAVADVVVDLVRDDSVSGEMRLFTG